MTEDDSRDEETSIILNQIAQGVLRTGKKVGKDLFLIPDRRQAIEQALSMAKSKKDIVLLLGKGHEKYIIRADGEHPWDESQVVRDYLSKHFTEPGKKKA